MRRILAPTLAMGTLVGLVFLAPPGARAASDGLQQGWWTALSAGGVVPGAVAGPDVPPDGLLVQGGTADSSSTAFAAIAVPVARGQARTLVVHAAAASFTISGSTIKACRLESPSFRPAQGGDIGDAPAYDCAGATTATAGADGITYSFDAQPLIADGIAAVALLPGSPTTRVVLARPGEDVLLYAEPWAEAPQPPAETPSAATVVSDAAPNPAARPSGGPAPETPGTPSARAVPVPAAAVLSAAALPDANPVAVLLVVLILAVAGTFWLRAGRAGLPSKQ